MIILASSNPLHAPLMPLLHMLLEGDSVSSNAPILDLACGEGDKLPLLRDTYGPAAQLVGVDIDSHSVAAYGSTGGTRAQSLLADAHHLPLQAASFERAVCIAALGLFDEPVQALCELRRVLRPNGRALVVTAAERWAAVTHWPAALVQAYAAALARGERVSADTDLAEPIITPLRAAGFSIIAPRAMLLDAANPQAAELALLPWAQLEPIVAAHLDAATLAQCRHAAAHAEIEQCSLVLAAWASITATE